MNGEIPSVPITTLAGVSSLTALLPELPLPTPLPHTVGNKSLLFNPQIADEARDIISSSPNEELVRDLLKDNLSADGIEGEIPELLKAMLDRDPEVFRSGMQYNSNATPNTNDISISFFSAGSPAQASSAPSDAAAEPSPYRHPVSTDDEQSRDSHVSSSNHVGQGGGSKSGEPVVLLEPLEPLLHEGLSLTPQVNPACQNVTGRNSSGRGRTPSSITSSVQQTPPRALLLSYLSLNPLRKGEVCGNNPGGASINHSPVTGVKRHRSHDDDAASNDSCDAAHVKSESDKCDEDYVPVEKSKRRKQRRLEYNDDDDEEEGEKEKEREKEDRQHKNKKKPSSKDERRIKRLELRVTLEDLMESPTFKRFNAAIDAILEGAEDVDLRELQLVTTEADSIISKSTLHELCSESAKLKTMGVMNQVKHSKLVKMLTILQFSIRDGCKIMAAMNPDDSREEEQLWREVTIERVLAAVDAALTALYVMTSPGMPKEVYIEDVIERVVSMAKMQLQNTIFPDYDPVYRIDPKGRSRSKASGSKHRSSIQLYNKLSDLVGTLSELIDMQELTDTIILQASTLAVSPFFVENINELQLNSLKLVTSVFTRYEKHRQLIVEDILSSLARLPSSKKNLRSYRLNAEEQIQMVTALLLQLIQCVVKLPRPEKEEKNMEERDETDRQRREREKNELMDKEVTIITSYENAMRTAHSFLVVFLRKCTSKGDDDYRPLFENFVYDLLATVNKPEWPAAELLLSLLGRLLVQQFSNKSVDMSLRTASLDYLGIVAARLRKDAVTSKLNEEIVDDIINHINEDDENNRIKPKKEEEGVTDIIIKIKVFHFYSLQETDRTQELQNALLEYLVYNAQNDHALMFARQFYIGQWFRDCTIEVEKAARRKEAKTKSKDHEEDVGKDAADEMEDTRLMQELVEKRKGFLMEHMASRVGIFANFNRLVYENACLVTRYLASNRPFSQSFDIYLTQILKVLCETAIAVRTKAMKCLSAVVEADPAILARSDMQKGVHGRFMDQSTSVREAAVELVGKFILVRPELTAQYYDMLSDRILDTGISVRKRVIKIFRDVCMEQPDFDKIPEMCVKMIRRVNDEEGIKKLVNETFQSMWFVPKKDRGADKLLTRVMNITDVVAACRETGYDWFEQLLDNLLKKEEDTAAKPVETACGLIVDCLVDNVLKLDAVSAADNQQRNYRLLACFSTLFLFCKVKPTLLVPHATTIHPYLNIKCSGQTELTVLHNVARILELAVPLMDHPSEGFLAQLEEDVMKLVLKHGMMVLQSCVSCLGAIVNKVTRNYKLVRDCFQKFFGVLSKMMTEHQRDSRSPALASSRPTLLRSLFTVGLLCKHFDFDSEDFGEKKVSIRDKVFDTMLYFVFTDDDEVKHKALTGVGFLVVRHYEFMLSRELKALYNEQLTDKFGSVRMRCQVLRNLQAYLMEEEEKMMRAEDEWKKRQEGEDLKEMGDVQSGMASTIIQVYLKQVLESFFHSHSQVRMSALNVIILILGQGLVHPVQCVPYLISMGSDCDNQIRIKADDQLKDIDKKYPGFIQMKALQGVKMSFKLQELMQQDSQEPIRGMREEDIPSALNAFIYTLIRGNSGQRRALLSSMLNMFDDTAKTPLAELVYYADNLAHFPFLIQSEPLFVIHQIDILVSVSGSNLVQSCKEVCIYFIVLNPAEADVDPNRKVEDDDEEDVDQLLEKLPSDCRQFQELYMGCQGCILLLGLKQHLKDNYGFTDAKIQRYSPTDSQAAKMFDKPLNRKHNVKFNPKQALDLIKQGPMPEYLDEDARRGLLQAYIDFKQLMLSIDPDDEEDEDGEGGTKKTVAPPPVTTADQPASDGIPKPVVISASGDNNSSAPRPAASSIERKKHRSSSSSKHSSSSQHHRSSSSSGLSRTPNKPSKHKKKRRRRRISDTDDDASDDSDPDFTI
ncbi:hypothetical protein CAPTEDRAFT_160616 [Capitella teleta]|uniref:Nipped-B protein n=1 Tax=Capitella teleta TaxID=283909 RepID=R7V8M4_CAPTE|nr:hypothetical protein CAPTEDRAFT_160616 [Capitella teleta]|eukprot:ELU12686.1 hypothetical protein CAPTEDRAFT_160616 [Capitella teleta]